MFALRQSELRNYGFVYVVYALKDWATLLVGGKREMKSGLMNYFFFVLVLSLPWVKTNWCQWMICLQCSFYAVRLEWELTLRQETTIIFHNQYLDNGIWMRTEFEGQGKEYFYTVAPRKADFLYEVNCSIIECKETQSMIYLWAIANFINCREMYAVHEDKSIVIKQPLKTIEMCPL